MLQILSISSVFVLGIVALAWTSYFGMRFVAGRLIGEETRDLASSVIFRVSALHGLILALVFSQEMADYQSLRDGIGEEAIAISDIYYDIDRYGGSAVPVVQTALAQYVALASREEWAALSETRTLLSDAWIKREIVYEAILDLDPQSPREEALRNHMLRQIQHIAELRQSRESTAATGIDGMFWFAALAGVVLVAIPYFTYPPTLLNLVLLSVFGAFTGLILLFIYAFNNPFTAPASLEPLALEKVVKIIVLPERGR